MIGGFNADLLKIDRDYNVFANMPTSSHLLSSDCRCKIDVPMRTTDTSSVLVDHIYTNKMRSDKLKFGVMKCEFPDHDFAFGLTQFKTTEPKEKTCKDT